MRLSITQYLLLACLLAPALAFAQPANDECTSALPVTVDGAAVNGTTVGATLSSQADVCTGTFDDDVWFSFVATGPNINLSTTTVSGTTDRAYEILSGTCASLLSLQCSDPEIFTITGLTTGQTYFIRVASWTATTTTRSTFTLTLASPPPPPANDECTSAVPITVDGAAVNGTTVSATTSSQPDVCAGTFDDDVWFSFVASGPNANVTTTNSTGSGTSDRAYEVLSGSCAGLTSLLCSDPESFSITGLTTGQTYYIRVASFSSTSTVRSTFTIAVTAPPTPPSNDECNGATAIATSPAGACNFVAASTVNALQSQPAPTCTSTSNNDDVWYSFVAPSNSLRVSFNNMVAATGTATSLGYAIYTSCGGTQIACTSSFGSAGSGNQVATLSPLLVPGQTYLIRVWTGGTSNSATFGLCLEANTVAAPPANDDCAGAFAATVAPAGACGSFPVSTAGALQSTPNPSCTSTSNNDDVWFRFTATSTGLQVSFSNLVAVTGTATQVGYAIYDACGGTQLACIFGFGSAGTGAPTIVGLTSPLTVGSDYILRTWTGGSANSGTYDFCLEAYTPPAPPANDECTGAFAVTVDGATVSGTTVSATLSSQADVCSGTFDDDVWFSFVANGPTVSLTTTTVSGTSDRAYEVLSGTCASLTSLQCSDPENFNITGLTAGQTYFIRVASFSATTTVRSEFTLTLTSPPAPPANDDCSGAVTITVDGAPISSSTAGATNSGIAGACSFSGSFDDDVWYRFTATGPTIDLATTAQMGTTDLAYELFSGSCATLTSIQCSDPQSFRITGLTIGTEYFLRIATYSFSSTAPGSFTISLTTPPPPPANDECSSALALFDVNGQPTGANGATFNTSSATGSNVPGSCMGGTPDDDLWFAVDAQPGSTLTISVAGASDFDGVLGVHTGACTSVGQVACVDNTFGGGTETYTFTTSLTGGGSGPSSPPTTYLIQVYDFFTGGGSFTITASLQAPLPVELTRLTAEAAGSRNVVRWAAASEVAFSHYVLERAVRDDLADFTSVTEVAARGAATGAEAVYEAYDAAPAAVTYYRLRAVDRDGSAEYSDVVAVRRTDVAGGGVKVWPNPAAAGGAVSIGLPVGLSEADVFVHDAAGREVTRLRATGTQVDLPLGGLPAGVYAVTARGATASQTVRLVIE